MKKEIILKALKEWFFEDVPDLIVGLLNIFWSYFLCFFTAFLSMVMFAHFLLYLGVI